MPRVPTILANQELQAPMFSSQADESSFGSLPGVGNLGRGLAAAGGGLQDLSAVVADLDKRRKGEDEDRWAGDALHQEQNHLSEWQTKEENNSGEDYAKNFLAYSESRIAEYEGKAPSKRAALTFRQGMQSFIRSRYTGALQTSEETRVGNNRDSIISQTSLALGTYRGSGAVPNVDAASELMWSHQDIRSRIERTFANPVIRRKLGAYVDSEIALGVAQQDPSTARSIITNSGDLEESAKVVLLNKIDAIEESARQVGRDDFNRFRADHLTLSREGRTRGMISLGDYKQHFDDGTAKRLKADDDQAQRIYGRANKGFDEFAGTNAQHQLRSLQKMRESIAGVEDDKVLVELARRLREVQELQEKDPVSWLSLHNPEVMEMTKRASAAATSESLMARHSSLLKYQGVPPPDEKNPERYLGLPILDRRLMTVGEVKRGQDYINQGTPPEAMKRIEEVLATYPGPDAQDVAFNDLSRDPDGIKQEYRLAWQNKNEWWVQSYVAAVNDAKGFSALSEERKGALSKEVDDNPDWKSFERYFTGADPTRADEVAGFKHGVMAYANFFSVTQGKNMRESVKESIGHLLNSTMGRTSVSGRTLWVMRERPGKPKRVDDEVADIGRRLIVSLKDLDPREIDQGKFPGLSAINPKEDNIDRLQALRDQVTRNGYFVPTADGQSMILYLAGDSGIPFEVRDKQGRAFMIELDDLPLFQTRLQQELDPTRTKLVATLSENDPRGSKISPDKTYPLRGFNSDASVLDKTLWYWGGAYNKRTYWPTNSGYWRRRAPAGPGSAGTFKR